MKVLLVDDHSLFREGLALLLHPLMPDLTVVEAGSCEDAFAAIEREGLPELVLMDLALPGMGGLEGIAVLHERHPLVPIVALSSSDDRDTVLRALDAGAMGFIPKSSTSSVMLGALRLVLSKGIYLPPSAFLAGRGATATQAAPELIAEEGTVEHRAVGALGLTRRQEDVLQLILRGLPVKLIARELGLSVSTVKAHTSVVLRALNVTTRTQAVVTAGQMGLRASGPVKPRSA